PLSTSLMLDQQVADSGSASSLMIAVGMIMGSLGIVLISFFDPHDLVQVIGTLNIVFGIISGGLWLIMTKRPLLRRVRGQ
ncbi:MAG: MFS transporter, partial [Alphaproteobacteria bacterium]|nr:MFS transporter [Alphaproteobacteria bacterium]